MTFSTSTLGTALEAAQTGLNSNQSDVIFWVVGVFLFTLVIGLASAAMNRARRNSIASVGGGRGRRR